VASLPEARPRRGALCALGCLGLLGAAALGGPAWLGAAGLAGGALWWWLGRRGGRAPGRARLRVLERARVDGGALQLVEVDGQRLLVGTGAGGPRLLARLTEAAGPEEAA